MDNIFPEIDSEEMSSSQDFPHPLLYNLLTFGSIDSQDQNNNKSENNSKMWKSIPSWAIYVQDQRHNFPRFDLANKCSVDTDLNKLVSLSLNDTCITRFDVDAIVNSTTTSYSYGEGVSKCIVEGAGKGLEDTCEFFEEPLRLGKAVITESFDLPSKYIIHTNGPCGYDTEWGINLRNCYFNCMQLLVDQGLSTIVFPCVSTGRKGVNSESAAKIALHTVRNFLDGNNRHKVERVIFSLHNVNAIDLYLRYMQIYFPVEPH